MVNPLGEEVGSGVGGKRSTKVVRSLLLTLVAQEVLVELTVAMFARNQEGGGSSIHGGHAHTYYSK